MTEIPPEKTHKLLEKLADYVMNEVSTKKEMNERFEHVESRLDHVESDVQETRVFRHM